MDTTSTAGILAQFALLINVPEAALRLLVSILLGFPLAFFHRHYLYGKNPTQQHLYFIVSSLVLGYWNYGFNIVHPIAAICITFLILKIIGGSQISVLVIFLFNMIYLLYGYYTTSTKNYDITWTMPQCVLTLRLIGLAFNLMDGKISDDKLSAFQKETNIKKAPSFLEISAFTLFPGSFLIGPQFSYRRYEDYVNGKLINSDGISKPNCLTAAFTRASLGFVYVAVYKIGTIYINEQHLLNASFYESGFFKQCFILGIWGRLNLYKYISCWLISEGVCTMFGLTYNGKDEKGLEKWNGCENVKLGLFENCSEFNHYIMSFNINTNHWCAEYIYKRLKFLGSKLYSQLVTLLFLSVWHGFHSGYYLCFFMEFIIMYFEKDFFPVLQKCEEWQKLKTESVLVRIAIWITLKVYVLVFMGYALIPFVYLSYPSYTQVFASVYYCGHIVFLGYPLLAPFLKRLILKPKRPSRQHQE
ncbi:lysophospholipid acyltransferase 5 [Prorops nasuta]|uniref:lysophospholipid acyltransferase 5 n=1 Tax=Prorops nasuta TaxID=863751 RepID=UPI0034CD5B77